MFIYVNPGCKLSVKLKKCIKLNKENKMNDVRILIYRTRTHTHTHTHTPRTKIDPKSSLVILVKKCKLGTTQEFHKTSKGSV